MITFCPIQFTDFYDDWRCIYITGLFWRSELRIVPNFNQQQRTETFKKLIAEIWDLQTLLIVEKWAEILTDGWEIAENLTDNWDSGPPIKTLLYLRW